MGAILDAFWAYPWWVQGLIMLVVVGGIMFYCHRIAAHGDFKRSREWREQWEEWAKCDFDWYKAEHPNAVKNGVSCRHCGGHKFNMVVQASANSYEKLHTGGSGVIYGPVIRYRSHICSTCGKEVYRSKGV